MEDALLRKYLLGELPEEERERIESRFLADEDFFTELLSVEDDLMDEYARGELDERERRRVEKHLLASPIQREKLRAAQVLSRRLPVAATIAPRRRKDSWSPPPLSWRQRPAALTARNRAVLVAAAAAALLLLVGAPWLAVKNLQLQNQIERLQAEQAALRQREQELQAKVAQEQGEKNELLQQLQRGGEQNRVAPPEPARPAPRIATFILMPASVRGSDEPAQFEAPPGTEMVQLQVNLENVGHVSYRAELRTADGEMVYQQQGIKARASRSGKALFIRIPEKRLRKRDYTLRISGITPGGGSEDAGFYSFRILQK